MLVAAGGPFTKASSVQLRNTMKTADEEGTRQACYDGLRSVGPHVAGARRARPACMQCVHAHAPAPTPAACSAVLRTAVCLRACQLRAKASKGMQSHARVGAGGGAASAACPHCRPAAGRAAAEKFCEIVKLRNKLARLQGYQDFYDMKASGAEGQRGSGAARPPACALP